MASELICCEICGRSFNKHGIGRHKWIKHGDGRFHKFTAWNKGLTKETSSIIRKQAEKVTRVRSELEKQLDDDGKLQTRYINKRVNANHENIPFSLTYEEYIQLVNAAGLVSSQLGFTGQKYVLARYNDEGGYTYGNCRFITQLENAHERKISDCCRESCRNNLKKVNQSKDYSNIVGKSVRCIEDNKDFISLTKASQFYGISTTTITCAIDKFNGYVRKIDKHFEYIRV